MHFPLDQVEDSPYAAEGVSVSNFPFSNIGLWGTRSGSNCCRRKSPRCFQLAETRREDY
jgi:hypothetical protein